MKNSDKPKIAPAAMSVKRYCFQCDALRWFRLRRSLAFGGYYCKDCGSRLPASKILEHD
jgi:hypothetical protein